MKKVFKVMLIVLAICLAVGVFSACGEPAHTHDYKTLKYDTENHWFECDCGEKSNINVHNMINYACVCGYSIIHTHNYTTLKYDKENHWYECSCGDKKDIENHKGGTATETEKAVCSVCSQEYGTFFDWESIFKVSNGTINGLTNYGKTLTEIIIPSKIKGVDIVAIESCAFYNCSSIESVTIPESIESIGNEAFNYCTALEEINYNAIECADFEYQYNVFSNAGKSGNGIKVVIGKNVKKVPAFLFCPYYVDSSYSPKIISVEFEEGSICESIGNNAFFDCNSLASIIIPDSVTSIGTIAFYDCDSLEYNIKEELKYLGNAGNPYLYLADTTSTSITNANIDKNCRFIGDYAFKDCTSLKSIVIPNSVTSIGYGAFYDCSLESIVIPDSVTSIGDSAFRYCASLTSVTIPDSVTSIGTWAFHDCDSLKSIIIPDSATSIGEHAFDDCDSLTIYCEATSKPSGWGFTWNYSKRPVVWGYKGE